MGGYARVIAWFEVPSYGLPQLFFDLSMETYLQRFVDEGVGLPELLDVDMPTLEGLGVRQLGRRMALRAAVLELARRLLQWVQERSLHAAGSSARLGQAAAGRQTGSVLESPLE